MKTFMITTKEYVVLNMFEVKAETEEEALKLLKEDDDYYYEVLDSEADETVKGEVVSIEDVTQSKADTKAYMEEQHTISRRAHYEQLKKEFG